MKIQTFKSHSIAIKILAVVSIVIILIGGLLNLLVPTPTPEEWSKKLNCVASVLDARGTLNLTVVPFGSNSLTTAYFYPLGTHQEVLSFELDSDGPYRLIDYDPSWFPNGVGRADIHNAAVKCSQG